MPIDPQDLNLVLGSNGGESQPADPQNVPLILGLTPNFAAGFAQLRFTAAGSGLRGVAGAAVATLLFTASGSGEHVTVGYDGDGQGRLAITASGSGAHGVFGNGLARLAISGAGAGNHGVSGTGVGRLAISGAGDGYLAPAGNGLATLLRAAGVGQFISLGFDPTKRLATGFVAPWAPAAALQPERRYPWTRAATLDDRRQIKWARGAALDQEDRIPWGEAVRRDRDLRVPWGRYERRLRTDMRYPWALSKKNDRDLVAPWGRYERALQPEARYPWGLSAKADRDLVVPWGGPLLIVQYEPRIPWGLSTPRQWEQYIPWSKYSRTLSPGWGIVTPATPGQVPGQTITVPIQRVYIVENTVLLLRTDNNVTIPALSMQLSLDYESWTWAFSASLARTALPLIQPNVNGDPVILEAQVNGVPFRVIVERVQRERSFGQERVRIGGRGQSALLDAPYAPIFSWANTGSRTAQQLANDALELNGVPIGWTVNWTLTDWLVPAGQWSVRGSHMDGLLAVVKAAGGYVRPDPADTILDVLGRYPVAPWDWGTVTPDFVLPTAVTTQEGIEWVSRPEYNAVYVSGTTTGPLALVRRTGSPADTFADMVTDALVTHADAARQRGLSVLGNTGRKAFVNLRLPVLDTTGVIQPGKFVDYVDGATTRRGLVRGVQVDANSTTDVWQTLTVETNA